MPTYSQILPWALAFFGFLILFGIIFQKKHKSDIDALKVDITLWKTNSNELSTTLENMRREVSDLTHERDDLKQFVSAFVSDEHALEVMGLATARMHEVCQKAVGDHGKFPTYDLDPGEFQRQLLMVVSIMASEAEVVERAADDWRSLMYLAMHAGYPTRIDPTTRRVIIDREKEASSAA